MAELIRFENVSKTFGEVKANHGVSFSIHQGSLHGIVGENGAGKSTIMKILYGMYPVDSGEIFFQGKPVHFKSPLDAIQRGLGMVHQHFMLVPTLKVWENIVLGSEPEGIRLHPSEIISELSLLQKEFGFNLDLEATIEDLSVGIQQQVEILKLLYRKAETLILDEPTAVLTPQEVDSLFAKLKTLKQQGKTIVLITHKLKEILSWTEFVTVMRHGAVVETVETKSLTENSLAEKIIGRKQKPLPKTQTNVSDSHPILELKNVSYDKLKNLSFSVKKGEIVGIAGIDGNGQAELADLLAGVGFPESGELCYDGKTAVAGKTLPLAMIPPDRHAQAAILEFTVEENAILGLQRSPRFREKVLLSKTKISDFAKNVMEAFDVRPRNCKAIFSGLSGGNQQKLVVGRESEKNAACLVACHPTRGVDIGAIEFIHSHLISLKNQGKGILLISSELDEILALSDRVIVLYHGSVAGEKIASEATERELGLWMTGATA